MEKWRERLFSSWEEGGDDSLKHLWTSSKEVHYFLLFAHENIHLKIYFVSFTLFLACCGLVQAYR